MVHFIIMKRRVILLVLAVFCLAAQASAYWVWTPQTKKWINPKTAVKGIPKEQFAFAMGFYDVKNYEEAKREFRKLIRAYPKSFEAAESQYYLGRCEEAEGDLYGAFQSFQKVIDKYPFSERIQEIIERQYKIGEAFMSGTKRKALGVPLPVEDPSIEIFMKVVENSTYGPLAAKAEYKLGLVLKGLARYYEAEDAFNKVITNYPDSEWVEAAKFQIASCRAGLSRGSDYDQGSTKEAKEQFEQFVRDHPDAVLSRDAEKNIDALREKEAQSNYAAALFYEKQAAYTSARIYYEDIINNYSESKWAAKAMERLRILDKRKKK